jgi:Holliday junction resolvase
MKEAELQAKIIKHLEGDGWFVLKLIQTNKNGIPDLEIIKQGRVIFLEIKNDAGKISDLQIYRIEQLKKFDTEAYLIKGWKGFVDFKNMIEK